MAGNKLPMSAIVVLWLFPLSAVVFLIIAISIPAYETRVGYFISIFSILFMLVNAIGCFFASFMLCGFYLSCKGSNSGKYFEYLKALFFNIFGGYYFIRKINDITMGGDVPLGKSYRIGYFGVYYFSAIATAIAVSIMMSKGVGS